MRSERSPDPTIDFDTDQPRAYASRKKIFDWAAKDKLLVAGAHLPFPGLGQIRKIGGQGYGWIPVDFTPIPPGKLPTPVNVAIPA